MIRRLAVSTAAVLFCLAGCSDRAEKPEASSDTGLNAPTAAPAASDAAAQPATGAGAAVASTTAAAVIPALPGAPAYAALYPGAELDGRPTIGAGDAGAGGLVTFRTSASKGLGGLEFLAGIPGSIGGAVFRFAVAIDNGFGAAIFAATMLQSIH